MGAIPVTERHASASTPASPHGEHIQSLIEGNQGCWENFLNHQFPRQMADGTAPLNGFRHYMVQDVTYLKYYDELRMQSINSPRSKASPGDIEVFMAKMYHHPRYAQFVRAACEQQLGIPQDVIQSEPMSKRLEKAIELYKRVAQEGDWLDMHIVFLPCIMGYYLIATRLLDSRTTIENTIYYTLWIRENANDISFSRYKQFINDTISKLSDSEKKWAYWHDIFGQACETERAFFETAYEDFKYDVISDGLYAIRSCGKSDAYLVPGEGGDVVALSQADSDSMRTRWELTNTKDGYLIKNVSTGALLGTPDAGRASSRYEVNGRGEGHVSWSLNAASLDGIRAYQLSVSSKLQLKLDVDVYHSGVFVTNDHAGSGQMWLLEAVA